MVRKILINNIAVSFITLLINKYTPSTVVVILTYFKENEHIYGTQNIMFYRLLGIIMTEFV
jgi:hypothetical protein